MNIVNVGYRSTNYYAIEIRGGWLLVDCGWPGTMPQFMAEFKRKNIAAAAIKYILATHFHPDHAGLAEEFKQMGAQLLLMQNQRGVLEPAGPTERGKMPASIHISPKNVLQLQFEQSRAFLAGIGLAGEIVATPGHSDDSVSLILDEGVAFTGDLPPENAIGDDDLKARASWDTIHAHNVRRVYPAHGSQISGGF